MENFSIVLENLTLMFQYFNFLLWPLMASLLIFTQMKRNSLLMRQNNKLEDYISGNSPKGRDVLQEEFLALPPVGKERQAYLTLLSKAVSEGKLAILPPTSVEEKSFISRGYFLVGEDYYIGTKEATDNSFGNITFWKKIGLYGVVYLYFTDGLLYYRRVSFKEDSYIKVSKEELSILASYKGSPKTNTASTQGLVL